MERHSAPPALFKGFNFNSKDQPHAALKTWSNFRMQNCKRGDADTATLPTIWPLSERDPGGCLNSDATGLIQYPHMWYDREWVDDQLQALEDSATLELDAENDTREPLAALEDRDKDIIQNDPASPKQDTEA